MDSGKRARSLFDAGTNCAQAVFVGCANGELSEREMLRVASCFGGGMSHTDHACGALTGGLMAIGARLGMDKVGDAEGKTRAGAAGESFVRLFRERFGATRCTDLIRFNLSDDSQLQAARTSGAFSTLCPVFVEGAAQLVRQIIEDNKSESGPSR